MGITIRPYAVRGAPGPVAAGGTLSLVRLLFLVGLGGGRSTCKSAKVGSPGFTTVKLGGPGPSFVT